MMSGDDTNPIFFNNNKKKIGRPEHSLPPTPIRPITSHLCLTLYRPQSGLHMCIIPESDYPPCFTN